MVIIRVKIVYIRDNNDNKNKYIRDNNEDENIRDKRQ